MNKKIAAVKSIVLAILKLKKNLLKLNPSQILKVPFLIITLAHQQISTFALSIFKLKAAKILKTALLIITLAHQHISTLALSIFKLTPSQILKTAFLIITLAHQQISTFASSIFKLTPSQILKTAFLIITVAHQQISTLSLSIFKLTPSQILKTAFLIITLAQQQIITLAQDSSHIRVALLTCGPGAQDDELYTTFGHSGIRVTDSSSVTDMVYNYGNFDEFEENFYLKFIKGKLLYYVSVENFIDFKFSYQSSGRSMTEQVLSLTASEKIAVQHFLNDNLLPANRYYKYDFCLDNCTTRLRDLIKKYHDSTFTQKPVMPVGSTFRQAIHFCVDRNNQQWGKLGIDILLGKPCDAIMTPEQMEFLPENLMKGLDSSNKKIVLSHQNVYDLNPVTQKKPFFTPFVVFSILFLAIVILSFINNKYLQIFIAGFDGLLFFFTGLLGILLIFMWFATDHSMTKNNFNLVWAWPLHVIIAFFVNSKKSWVKKYFAFAITGLIIVLLSWFFLPQQMNNALLPMVLLLLYRSVRRYQAF